MQWIVEVDERIPHKDDSMWYWRQTDEVIVGFACERYWIDIIPRGSIRIETPEMRWCGMGCSGDCEGNPYEGECEMNHFCFNANTGETKGGKLTAALIISPYVKERNHFDIEVIDIEKAQDATEFAQFARLLLPRNTLSDAIEAAVFEMARLDKGV